MGELHIVVFAASAHVEMNNQSRLRAAVQGGEDVSCCGGWVTLLHNREHRVPRTNKQLALQQLCLDHEHELGSLRPLHCAIPVTIVHPLQDWLRHQTTWQAWRCWKVAKHIRSCRRHAAALAQH